MVICSFKSSSNHIDLQHYAKQRLLQRLLPVLNTVNESLCVFIDYFKTGLTSRNLSFTRQISLEYQLANSFRSIFV